jgi:HD-GYP domain-containing protein (c-di-GMP phosphodiesterase class II)
VRPIIRCHHERLDGSGYPQGLRGDDVPLLAQIVAIADVYDALTSPRSYRAALPGDTAARHLTQLARDGKFEREHVEAFLSLAGVNVGPGR